MNVGQNLGNTGTDAGVNTSLVIGLTFVATLGGLLFGYDTAVISGAVTSIDAYFIDPLGLSETARSSLSGWTISSALLGCIIGAMVAGWVSTALGRRGGLMIAGLMFLLGSIGSAWPEFGFGPIGQMGPDALRQFIFYRILGGVGVGIASMLSPLYIAEISPSAIRGRLVSFNQLAIVGGILLVYIVNSFVASHGDEAWIKSTGWRYMLASEAIPSAILLVLLMFVPDTPRWLVLRGRSTEALTQLRRVMGESDARAILADIERTMVVSSHKLLSFGLPVILIGIMISVFQQFVGINAVLYYAPLMFQNMGASTDTAPAGHRSRDHGGSDDCTRLPLQCENCRPGSADRRGRLYRGLCAIVGTRRLGDAVGDVSQRHQGQGDGHRGRGAMDCQSAGLGVLQGAGRQLRVECNVQSWIRLLDLRRHERVGCIIRAPVCAGDQGPQPGGHPGPVG